MELLQATSMRCSDDGLIIGGWFAHAFTESTRELDHSLQRKSRVAAAAPRSCAETNIAATRRAVCRRKYRPQRAPGVTAGLKRAPEIGPKVRISATSPAPVASELASKAKAPLPSASRSPMMPEPPTVASNSAVPTASAVARWAMPIYDCPVSFNRDCKVARRIQAFLDLSLEHLD